MVACSAGTKQLCLILPLPLISGATSFFFVDITSQFFVRLIVCLHLKLRDKKSFLSVLKENNNFGVHYVKQSDSYEVLQEKLLYMFCAMEKTA